MNAIDEAMARATRDARLAEAHQRHLAHGARPTRRTHARSVSSPPTTWWSRMFRTLGRAPTPDSASPSAALSEPLAQVAPITALRTGRPRSPHLDDVGRQLDAVLGEVALRVAEHGTRSQAPILEAMAAAADGRSPGAAAALVDWNGTEVARQRAFGVVHGVVLDALDPHAQAFLVGLVLGADLRLAG